MFCSILYRLSLYLAVVSTVPNSIYHNVTLRNTDVTFLYTIRPSEPSRGARVTTHVNRIMRAEEEDDDDEMNSLL